MTFQFQYLIKKIGGFYCVVTQMNQTNVHFKSLDKNYCRDYIETRNKELENE